MPKSKTLEKTFKPYGGHRLWVEPVQGETMMGKIALPEGYSREGVPIKGSVVAVSKKVQDVKEGDHVLFKIGVGQPIVFDNKELVSIEEDYVYAVANGPDIKDVRPIDNVVFMDWDFASDTFPGTEIIMPDTTKEKQYTGTVLAIGSQVKEVKVGDRVVFFRFSIQARLYEKLKRYAFMAEELCEAIIPARKS